MRALLDACVLYPTLLRDILLGVARTDAFAPLWSARILEEWRRAALRNHPEQAASVPGEIALVNTAWPGSEVQVADRAEEGLSLPDENDIHVLAAAITAQADVIVTLNLRDFPPRALARHGCRVEHPDPFLLALFREDPQRVGAAIDSALSPARAAAVSLTDRSLLKRARLPRLGKALSSN